MDKRFFYEFSGRIFLNAKNENEAENMITDIDLNDYVIDEDLYEIDEDYVPIDLSKRQEKLGTVYHPMDNSEEYETFRRQVRKYGGIFKEFLNGKINQSELIKKMDQAEGKEIDDGSLIYQVQMVDLETKQGKTRKLVHVN